jgi:hypothetical protein
MFVGECLDHVRIVLPSDSIVNRWYGKKPARGPVGRRAASTDFSSNAWSGGFLEMSGSAWCPEPTVEEPGSHRSPGTPKMGEPTFAMR